jgi:hypothetical protein
MMMQDTASSVGRVLRASTTGFDCGTRSNKIDDRHSFGAFVKVPLTENADMCAIGLIYAIRIDDDPLARELVMSSVVDNSTLLDQRENRMVPVEICVVNIGYNYYGNMIQSLPPRPPMSLSEVSLCDTEEIYHFTQKCDFFRLVLNASDISPDDLMGAALRYAAWAYPEDQRYDFLVKCGRQLASMLTGDLKRLSHILTLIRPA